MELMGRFLFPVQCTTQMKYSLNINVVDNCCVLWYNLGILTAINERNTYVNGYKNVVYSASKYP